MKKILMPDKKPVTFIEVKGIEEKTPLYLSMRSAFLRTIWLKATVQQP